MKKVIFTAPGRAEITETKRPVPKEGQVLLKAKRLGVCGSDMQVFSGNNRYMTFPVTPFHEGLLEVAETGSEDSDLRPGTLATVWPFIDCGACSSCKNGRPNACMNFTCLGIQADGLGAEYYLSEKKYVYPLPDGLNPDEAVLIEPLSIGIHAAGRGEVSGKRVLVVGAGTIGNMTAQACRICGAERVVVCDVAREKIDLAAEVGIDGINNRDRTLREVALEMFGDFPEAVIDCAGFGPTTEQIFEIGGKTTTVVIVANSSKPVSLLMSSIQRNELDVKGCIGSRPEDFQAAVHAVAAGKLNAKGFITARYEGLSQVQEMMEYTIANRSRNMKTILELA
ncbi:MAG: alcohol dehydrogenase catalytic domain-containing protein [Lachnospiraceae bacterium]|jgi:threonine dehydrogenase-like Zn-dependent dehydrogenase|nr:alcohol dehydrogenase catalytic domain-containing protein [Lachnospiraceae bacterium]